MKRALLLIAIICLLTQLVVADEPETNQKRVIRVVKNPVNFDEDDFDFDIEVKTDYEDYDEDSKNRAYLGVYLKDMDFEDAYKMRYKYYYGVLVKGVVSNTPAEKAGLMEDDIIMEFDGKKALYEDYLSQLLKRKNPGDKVEIKYFRYDTIYTTTATLTSKTAPHGGEISKTKKSTRKKKQLSVGYGGGSWIPVWFTPDIDDINEAVEGYGFSKIKDNGLFLNGGGGKGMIGKGYFLGGMGCGYSIDRKIDHTTTDNTPVVRRMQYSVSYGGVTLDKRFAFSRKLVSSLGFMLGWGGNNLKISQTNGDYDWDELNANMDSSANNYIEMEKNYILFQPKVMLMYRITSWLGLRAEAGYMLSYSYHNGWDVNLCEDSFELTDSPETSFNGMTASIGPWFGF